jgi:hypothetical protein
VCVRFEVGAGVRFVVGVVAAEELRGPHSCHVGLHVPFAPGTRKNRRPNNPVPVRSSGRNPNVPRTIIALVAILKQTHGKRIV